MNKNNSLPFELLESESEKNNLDSEKTKEKKINDFICMELEKDINERLNIHENKPPRRLEITGYKDKIIVSNIKQYLTKKEINSIDRIIGFDNYRLNLISSTNTFSIEFFNNEKEVFEEVD